jgi:membrane-associated phospholipid phosphatase
MKKTLFLSLWLFFAAGAQAEEAPSIYSTHLPTDLTITGASLLTTTLLYAFEGKIINRRCPCLTSEINSFDRGVVGNHNDTALLFTDIGVGAAMTVPILADWILLDGWNQAFIEDTLVFTQVLAVTGAFTTVIKSIVQRPIPRAYEGDPDAMSKATGYRSFFSGHVSMMTAALTAAAVTVEARTGARVWPWFVVGGGGLLVAAGRVAGGVHFYSDVIVGGAVGVGAGLLIPWLHKRRGEMGSVMVVPQHGGALALWSKAL